MVSKLGMGYFRKRCLGICTILIWNQLESYLNYLFSLPESKQSVPFVNHECAQLFKISDPQLPHSKQLMQAVGFIPALHDQQAFHFGNHVLNHFQIT
jgi:hypothetical protein